MNNSFINIGYGNMVAAGKILAIVHPEPAPIRRLIAEHKASGKIIDATAGRRTRAVLISNGEYIILSSLQPETIANRLQEVSP